MKHAGYSWCLTQPAPRKAAHRKTYMCGTQNLCTPLTCIEHTWQDTTSVVSKSNAFFSHCIMADNNFCIDPGRCLRQRFLALNRSPSTCTISVSTSFLSDASMLCHLHGGIGFIAQCIPVWRWKVILSKHFLWTGIPSFQLRKLLHARLMIITKFFPQDLIMLPFGGKRS